MASSLSRLSWTFLAKRHVNLSRCTAVFAGRYTQIQSIHSQQQERKIHERRTNNLLTYTALASGLCYAVYKWKDDIRKGIRSPGVYSTVYAVPNNGQNRDKYNFIADVVEICGPAVVHIEVKDNRRQDPFAKTIAVGGSGFIVSKDGLILTNAHVVLSQPNITVQVRLHDDSVHTAVIEDIDVHSDLATIRINKTNLPVMKLGNSSNLRPGEFVVAMGCPLNFRNTVTSGVVSSVNRQSTEIGLHNTIEYIQTDAAITFGNSGGPLVNLDGEAIGINSIKVTSGISFAIPIDYAKEFLKKVETRKKEGKKQKERRKRYLGMVMHSLMPDILAQIRQDSKYMFMTHGVLVWKVIPESPADKAGIRSKDIITHANNEPVVCTDNIYKFLEKPEKIHFIVIRDGLTLYIDVHPEDVE